MTNVVGADGHPECPCRRVVLHRSRQELSPSEKIVFFCFDRGCFDFIPEINRENGTLYGELLGASLHCASHHLDEGWHLFDRGRQVEEGANHQNPKKEGPPFEILTDCSQAQAPPRAPPTSACLAPWAQTTWVVATGCSNKICTFPDAKSASAFSGVARGRNKVHNSDDVFATFA